MKYKELWLPVLILFSVAPIIASLDRGGDLTRIIFGLLWAGIFIYYLRWKNSGTPFINTLTILLTFILEGIYILDKYPGIGKWTVLLGGIGFLTIYLMRVRSKEKNEKEGRFILLKVICVILFVAGNFIYMEYYPRFIGAQVLGSFTLALGYVYDRIRNYDRIKTGQMS